MGYVPPSVNDNRQRVSVAHKFGAANDCFCDAVVQVCMLRNVCLVDGDWTVFRPAVTSQTPPSYDLNLMENGQSATMLLAHLRSCTHILRKSLIQASFICTRGQNTARSIQKQNSMIFPDGSPPYAQHATCALFAIERRRLCSPVWRILSSVFLLPFISLSSPLHTTYLQVMFGTLPSDASFAHDADVHLLFRNSDPQFVSN